MEKKVRFYSPTISEGMLDACQRIIESNISQDAVELAQEIVRIAPEINAIPKEVQKLVAHLSGKTVTGSSVNFIDDE